MHQLAGSCWPAEAVSLAKVKLQNIVQEIVQEIHQLGFLTSELRRYPTKRGTSGSHLASGLTVEAPEYGKARTHRAVVVESEGAGVMRLSPLPGVASVGLRQATATLDKTD